MDLITALKIGYFYESDGEQDVLPVSSKGNIIDSEKIMSSETEKQSKTENEDLPLPDIPLPA